MPRARADDAGADDRDARDVSGYGEILTREDRVERGIEVVVTMAVRRLHVARRHPAASCAGHPYRRGGAKRR